MHLRSHPWRALCLSVPLALLILTGCAAPPKRPAQFTQGNYDYATQYLTWLIPQEMQKHNVVGMSIALIDDQQVVWAEGFGHSSRSKKVRATADTIYQIGSVSKVITATAVMQLVEAGKVEIDKPLQTYLPEFGIKTRFPNSGPITPRTLLTHHSGIPSDRIYGFAAVPPNSPPVPFTQLASLLKDEYVCNPPNAIFSYCNQGFSLLGHLVQQVSGEEFVAHMDRSMLQPMGMTHSSFAVNPSLAPLCSKGYIKNKECEPLRIRDMPAGSMVSNVRDMSRLAMMVFGNGTVADHRIIRPETLREMLRVQNPNVPLDLGFQLGLAWMLMPPQEIDYAGPIAWHNGGTIAHCSSFVCLLQHKLAVVILTNTDTGGEVASKVSNEAFKLMLEIKSGLKPPKPAASAAPTIVKRSRDELKPNDGLYATGAGLIPVRAENNAIRTKFMGMSVRLKPLADGRYLPKLYFLGFIPLSIDALNDVRVSLGTIDGRQVIGVHKGKLSMPVGERVTPSDIPQAWQQSLGQYEITNRPEGEYPLISNARLKIKDKFLVMEARVLNDSPMEVLLRPVSDTEAVVMGLGRSTGETLFLTRQDNQCTIRFSGYLLKRKK